MVNPAVPEDTTAQLAAEATASEESLGGYQSAPRGSGVVERAAPEQAAAEPTPVQGGYMSAPAEDRHTPETPPSRSPDGGGYMSSPTKPKASFVDQAQTTLARTSGSAVEAGYTVAGLTVGAKAGLLGGPFAWATVPLGAMVGAGLGYMVGDTVVEQLEKWGMATDNDITNVPPELRPAWVVGDVIGGVGSFTGSAMAIARSGARMAPSVVGRFINRVLDGAAHNGKAFVTVETLSGTSAAAGGAFAEAHAPGEFWKRIGAEVTMGMLNPAQYIGQGAFKLVTGGVSFAKRFTDNGRKIVGGKRLIAALEEAGEDKDAQMAIIDAAMKDGTFKELSASQLTGGRGWAEVEGELARGSTRFARDFRQRAQAGMARLRTLVDALRGSGDAQSFAMAMRLRDGGFRSLIEGMAMDMEQEATRAAAKMGTASNAERMAASVEIGGVVDRSLSRARDLEKIMYKNVAKETLDEPSSWNSVFKALGRAEGERLPTQKMPAVLGKFLEQQKWARTVVRRADSGQTHMPGKGGEKITDAMVKRAQKRLQVRMLMKLRTWALQRARGAAKSTAEDSEQNARMYGMIAEGSLNDMISVGARTRNLQGTGRLVKGATELDDASAFSKAINDTYKRAFAGRVSALGSRGEDALPPELIAKTAMAQGDEASAIALRDLEEAANFLFEQGSHNTRVAKYLGDKGAKVAGEQQVDLNQMLDLQERVVAHAATAARNADGRVTVEAVTDALDTMAPVLDRFPEVRRILQNALKSEKALKDYEQWSAGVTKYYTQNSAVKFALKWENPVDAVGGALASPNPIKTLREYMRQARKANNAEDAVGGLRSAIFDHVASGSEHLDTKTLSIADMASHLFDPIRRVRENPSLMDIMIQEKLISQADANEIARLVTVGERIASSVKVGKMPADVLDEPASFMMDFMMRAAGTKAGAIFAKTFQAGPSLLLAQRGSEGVRRFAHKLPWTKTKELLWKALRGDPIEPGGEPFSLLHEMVDVAETVAQQDLKMRRLWLVATAMVPEQIHGRAVTGNKEEIAGEAETAAEKRQSSFNVVEPAAAAELPAGLQEVDRQIEANIQAIWTDQGKEPPPGVRNNNPGNVRIGKSAWEGATGDADGFVTFSHPRFGIRAMARTLRSYSRIEGRKHAGEDRKINTLFEAISTYAPKEDDNDPVAYSASVAETMGIKPDDKINLEDEATMQAVVRAMIQVEIGGNPYPDNMITTAVKKGLAG